MDRRARFPFDGANGVATGRGGGGNAKACGTMSRGCAGWGFAIVLAAIVEVVAWPAGGLQLVRATVTRMER